MCNRRAGKGVIVGREKSGRVKMWRTKGREGSQEREEGK